MTIPAAQAEAAALLARITGAAPIETHISAVYVGARAAYKLKKAVALGFLDFSTLAARERFTRRELAVNQPHAPDLYRDVAPITRGADGALRIGGEGAAEEWVLVMAPLAPDCFLDILAARQGLAPAMLDDLADMVAALHTAAPVAAGFDVASATARVIAGNERAARDAGLPPARIAAWARAAEQALARLAPALALRAAGGQVRRCHGDLHLGNVCLWHGAPTPFDALEFDEELATVDTGYDLAFLLMDVEQRLGRGAANRVLNRYVARTGDVGLVAGLPLWLSLRAVIRAHVRASRGDDGVALLDAADAYLRPGPARLIAIGGLQGSGKSRLAYALAPEIGPAPGALVLRSDEIRKRRFGRAPGERLPPEAYAESVSRAVLAELGELARQAVACGHAAIGDATFLDPADRVAIEDAARIARARPVRMESFKPIPCAGSPGSSAADVRSPECEGSRESGSGSGLPFTGLWLEAPMEVLKARIAARRGDASDATVAVLESAAARDPGPIAWHRVAADPDPLPASRLALSLPAPASC